MTAIQNIHTPTIHVSTGFIRKAATALLSLAGVALFVLAITAAPGLSFFAVLVTSVVGIAVLGMCEVNEDAKKPQFDVR
jgi:hypothetical protein